MNRYLSYIKKGVLAGTAIAALALSGYALKGSPGTAATLARDCEATAIIYCGSTSVNELVTDYNTRDGGRYSDIPAVFNYFGISAAEVQNLGSNYKMGKVKADGTVWIGDQKIGVNSITAGRSVKPGSVPIPGTGAYTRSPSVSFSSPSTVIDAFIGYENGAPAWAVLTSCGNPVKWDKPAIEIEKTVRNAANTAWVENDTFANNSTLTYRLQVRNTGKVADTNVMVKDTLPAINSFVPGSVKINGVAQGSGADSLVTTGINIGTVNAGATVEITFQAKVSVADTKCGNTAFMNKAVVDGSMTTPDEDTAGGNVNVVCVSFKCESLTASKTAIKLGDSVTYTAKAVVENATVMSYEFRVNGAVVQNTTSDTYNFTQATAGTYTVKVTVVTDKGSDTNMNCEVKLSVNEKPVCPYNPQLPPESPECKKPEVCPYNPALPKNSPDCKKPEVCPYNPELPMGSPDCKKPAEPQVLPAVTILPNTGAGNIVGLFSAVTIAGAVAHRALSIRRAGR